MKLYGVHLQNDSTRRLVYNVDDLYVVAESMESALVILSELCERMSSAMRKKGLVSIADNIHPTQIHELGNLLIEGVCADKPSLDELAESFAKSAKEEEDA